MHTFEIATKYAELLKPFITHKVNNNNHFAKEFIDTLSDYWTIAIIRLYQKDENHTNPNFKYVQKAFQAAVLNQIFELPERETLYEYIHRIYVDYVDLPDQELYPSTDYPKPLVNQFLAYVNQHHTEPIEEAEPIFINAFIITLDHIIGVESKIIQ